MRLPQAGELFQGKYRLERVLGRGGYATVFLAVDEKAERRTAIKLIEAQEGGYAAGAEARFMREVRVLGNLRDPHTITMFDYGQTSDGLLYMVFEYVEGRDLDAVIREDGPMSEETTCHVLSQVLHSLREAHANGLLHRDLKPQNIMIFEYMGDQWSAKLLDFGIALHVDTKEERITKQGAIVGTPRYLAPELIFGTAASAASDIYGLGLVVFEMLAGRPAVDGASHAEMLQKQISDEPILLPADVSVSAEIRALVERMVAKAPNDRYQSVAEVMTDLDDGRATLRPVGEKEPARAKPTPSDPAADDVPTVPSLPAAPLPADTVEDPPRLPSSEARAGEEPAPELDRGRNALAPLVVSMVVAMLGVSVAVALVISSSDEPPKADPPTSEPAPVSASVEDDVQPPAADAIEVARLELNLARKLAAKDHALVTPCTGAVKGGEEVVSYAFEGAPRRVLFYAPRNAARGVQHPIVLMYHGQREQRVGQFLGDSGLVRAAEANGLILVSPQAPESDERSMLSTPIWQDIDVEVRFAKHLVEDAARRYCIDPGLVYVVGHATGAAVAEVLRCRLPISAVALTSSRLQRGAPLCRTETDVPVLDVWGEADQFNNAAGTTSEGCLIAGVPVTRKEHVIRWRDVSGCEGNPRSYPSPRAVDCFEWNDCDSTFVSCTHPYGVGWPDTSYQGIESMLSSCFGPPAKFDLPSLVYDFFQAKGRRIDGE